MDKKCYTVVSDSNFAAIVYHSSMDYRYHVMLWDVADDDVLDDGIVPIQYADNAKASCKAAYRAYRMAREDFAEGVDMSDKEGGTPAYWSFEEHDNVVHLAIKAMK